MRFLVVILCACAATVLCEEVTGHVNSTAAEDDRVCPSVPGGNVYRIKWVRREMAACLNTSNLARINGAKNATMAWMRQEFSEYCQGAPTMKSCLTGVYETSKLCLNQTDSYRRFFLRFDDSLKSFLDYGCADKGVPLAKISFGLRSQKSDKQKLKICKAQLSKIRNVFRRVPDVCHKSSKLIWNRCKKSFYKLRNVFSHTTDTSVIERRIVASLRSLKPCVLYGIRNDRKLKTSFGAFMDNQVKFFTRSKNLKDGTL